MSYSKGLSLKSFLPAKPRSLDRLPLGRKAVLLVRSWFFESETDRLMALSMLFGCGLALWRIVHTGHATFLSLVWNLFLAYIPYFITARLSAQPQWISRKLIFIPILIVWLLFIPNSFYILTDLFHLVDKRDDRIVPLWFDLVLILSFAWNGLLLGILSVRKMEKLLQTGASLRAELLFLCPVMGLNALGVYIGRYLRYNSWDVITDPFDLIRDIAGMVIHPLRHHYAWDMILCFSILMTLMYLMMKRISRTLA